MTNHNRAIVTHARTHIITCLTPIRQSPPHIPFLHRRNIYRTCWFLSFIVNYVCCMFMSFFCSSVLSSFEKCWTVVDERDMAKILWSISNEKKSVRVLQRVYVDVASKTFPRWMWTCLGCRKTPSTRGQPPTMLWAVKLIPGKVLTSCWVRTCDPWHHSAGAQPLGHRNSLFAWSTCWPLGCPVCFISVIFPKSK